MCSWEHASKEHVGLQTSIPIKERRLEGLSSACNLIMHAIWSIECRLYGSDKVFIKASGKMLVANTLYTPSMRRLQRVISFSPRAVACLNQRLDNSLPIRELFNYSTAPITPLVVGGVSDSCSWPGECAVGRVFIVLIELIQFLKP